MFVDRKPKTTNVVPRARARVKSKKMSRTRAFLFFLGGWVALLTACFIVYCDRLGNVRKSLIDDQYRMTMVSRSTFLPYTKICDIDDDNSPAGLPQDQKHRWVGIPVGENYTLDILGAINKNGTSLSRCHLTRTRTAHVFGLPKARINGTIELTAGPIHEIRIVSIGPNGENRCAGGDYYETELSSMFWKSRPLVRDLHDGSYRVSLQVDMRFAGLFDFKVVLLFANFHAMDPLPDPLSSEANNSWARMQEIQNLKIRFVVSPMTMVETPLLPPKKAIDSHNTMSSKASHLSNSSVAKVQTVPCLPRLSRCTSKDYNLRQWTGRWTREALNISCESGRQRNPSKCLKARVKCEQPWCHGPVGLLHSNGWVYSAHCSFKIFTRDEAWMCLNGQWLLWVGDSTDQDTAYTLLSLVLGIDHEEVVSVLNQNGEHKSIHIPTDAEETVRNQHNSQSQGMNDSSSRSLKRPGAEADLKSDSFFLLPLVQEDLKMQRETAHDSHLQQEHHKVHLETRVPTRVVRDSLGRRLKNETIRKGPSGKLKRPEDVVLEVEHESPEQVSMVKRFIQKLVGKFTRHRKRGPIKYNQSLRLNFVHNHADADKKTRFPALYSLANTGFRELIKSYFFWGTTPDIIIVDFGLRNAWYFKDAAKFVEEGLKLAISFWKKLLHELDPRFPLFIFRSAFAVAGRSRAKFYNPHKIELYNRIIAEKFVDFEEKEKLPNVRVVDAFDLTFPWHFDHNFSSDGIHYGTAHSQRHEHYFVDLMLVHILLNTMCETHAPFANGRKKVKPPVLNQRRSRH